MYGFLTYNTSRSSRTGPSSAVLQRHFIGGNHGRSAHQPCTRWLWLLHQALGCLGLRTQHFVLVDAKEICTNLRTSAPGISYEV